MEPYDLDNALGFWLHLTFNRMRTESVRRFATWGYPIPPEQWALLVRLWAEDGRTQSELAELTFRDRPAVTRMIDALEKAGYVQRTDDPRDRRVKRVVLTDEGRALEAELVPRVRGLVAEFASGITAEEAQTTLRVLRRMYANFES